MKGTLRLKEIAEGGTTTHELALTRLSLWNKERDGGRCPASLPFTLSLPATFNDGRTDYVRIWSPVCMRSYSSHSQAVTSDL